MEKQKTLSDAEKLTNLETMKHIENVRNNLTTMAVKLLGRAKMHDLSKLSPPEVEIFTEYTSKLRGTTYGSDEYKEMLKEMKPALDHHYSYNRHHPEYHRNGIKDMNLIDIMEMFCDALAAVQRHQDGDIKKSIEINQKRFNYSDDLKSILLNSIF